MSEAFNISGESSDITAGPAPQLQGLFVPGIDNPLAVDGFGLSIPWGGGGTARRYGDYGISTEISRQSTQLNDLAGSLISAEGGGLGYGIQGDKGPQGIQGPRGLPGIITVMDLNLPQNSNFLAALPHNIDQINDLGTATDKLIYTSAYTSYGGGEPTGEDLVSGTTDGDTLPEPWPPTNPEEREISFGAGIELTEGVTYAIVVRASDAVDADDAGLWQMITDGSEYGGIAHFYSTDGGTSWTSQTPAKVWFKAYAGAALRDNCSFDYTGAGAWLYGSAYWSAITFTASSTYTVTSVKLKLYRVAGATPGTITVSIKAIASPEYSEATWAESALTSAGRALMDDANAAAQATTLELGTTDSPTWVGATFSGLTASKLVASDGSKELESVSGTSVHPEFLGITIKDSGDNIVFYVDDDEMYFTSGAIAIADGMPIGLLLVLTYNV